MTNTLKSSIYMALLTANYFLMALLLPVIEPFLPKSPLFQLVLSNVTIFLLPLIIISLEKGEILNTFKINPIGIKNGLIIILASFLIQPFLSFLSFLSQFFFKNYINEMLNMYSLPVLVIGSAVCPAVFEEVMFRGIIFGTLKKTNTILKSALISGLFFGIMHFNGQQFLYAAFMGVVFSYVVYKTNSLLSSILMHFSINFSQILLFFAQTNSSDSAETVTEILSLNESLYQLGSILIFSLPLLAFGIYIIKFLKPVVPFEKTDYSKFSKEKLISAPFVAVIFMYILNILFLS